MKHSTIWITVTAGVLALAGTAHAQSPTRLTLAQAVAQASGRSPNVSLAQLRTDEAAARVGQARAALLPSLTAQASMVDRTYDISSLGMGGLLGSFPYKLQLLQGPVYDSEARLIVSQPLFNLAAWRRLRASQLGTLGVRADQGVTAEAAARGAALAYLRATRAEAVVHARARDGALAEQLASLADAQLAAGTSPSIDVTRARTQVAQARGALLIARNQLDRARIDLARTLGLDPSTPLETADSLSADLGASGVPADAQAALTFALEHRDELRAEQARLQRAGADRSAMASERVPHVDASADWGRSGEHFGDGIATYTLVLSASVPIFDGFRRENRITEQRAVEREAEVRAHDVRDQVAADVDGTLLDLANGVEQQSIAAERLKLAEEEVAQAKDRFTSGVAGSIELINAQATMVRARDADIDARFAIANARIALAHAAGVARDLH